MMKRKFYTLDVFTDTPLEGNPLAVVMDCEGLSEQRMQAIAREFALSETVFVFEPHDPIHTARLRIFTPSRELPFAGHPTIGAAVLIAQMRAADVMAREEVGLMLEEQVGVIACSACQMRGKAAQASFTLPQLPQHVSDARDAAGIAAALGLHASDIGFDDHRPGMWSAGNPFTFVPIASLEAIQRAKPNAALFASAFEAARPAAYLYTKEVMREGSHVHARMFAPGLGISEDPATGSAAAAFAGVATFFEKPEDGEHLITIEQGFEMHRPSLIHLRMTIEGCSLSAASIGGFAVQVAEGVLNA
jgi:trans-2,3-dihydro-3-hydroxyanthranilate isomerase